MWVTPGNVHDIQVLPELCQGLTGAMSADKGYISAELREELAKKGLRLVTKVRKNMQPVDHSPEDKKLLSSFQHRPHSTSQPRKLYDKRITSTSSLLHAL